MLFGITGLILAWRGRRLGLMLLTVSLAGFTGILLLPFHQWLLLPLENRFPVSEPAPKHVVGVILLGGAEEVELTEARGVPSFNATMETLTTFVALARRYPDAALAFSGGSGAMTGSKMSEADVSRLLFNDLGLDRHVTYEGASRDTYENAVLLKEIVQPKSGEVWLLITAASHMPRSVGCFRAAGWQVTAWPVSFKSGDTLAVQFRHVDLGGHLSDLNTALHEWEGLLFYWILGRTDTLFPSPSKE